MEVSLAARVLQGLVFAVLAYVLWKKAAPTRWHKAFILLLCLAVIYFLTRKNLTWA